MALESDRRSAALKNIREPLEVNRGGSRAVRRPELSYDVMQVNLTVFQNAEICGDDLVLHLVLQSF
jgi:hypothetical protein